MKIVMILSLGGLLWACEGDKQSDLRAQDPVVVEKLNPDSSAAESLEIQADTSTGAQRRMPTEVFVQLVKEIEGLGWVGDIVRLRKVPIYSDLKRDSVVLFHNRPFYPLNAARSLVLTYRGYDYVDFIDTAGIHLLKEAKSGWGYF